MNIKIRVEQFVPIRPNGINPSLKWSASLVDGNGNSCFGEGSKVFINPDIKDGIGRHDLVYGFGNTRQEAIDQLVEKRKKIEKDREIENKLKAEAEYLTVEI